MVDNRSCTAKITPSKMLREFPVFIPLIPPLCDTALPAAAPGARCTDTTTGLNHPVPCGAYVLACRLLKENTFRFVPLSTAVDNFSSSRRPAVSSKCANNEFFPRRRDDDSDVHASSTLCARLCVCACAL